MHYTFPEITHLDQVLEAVQGVEGFIVAQRDWGTVVNYIQMGPDMFPEVHTAGGSASMCERQTRLNAIRRECRGLLFALDGNLVSRPFQKFWNVGERRETLLENIDLTQPHIILAKLDGCLSADTVVDTPYGKMTMKDICAADSDIPVRAYDHQTRQDVWAQVQGTSVKESADNWYRVTLDDGRTIELTDNHKVWCVNKKAYLTAADLEEDDEVQLLNE